MLPLDREQLDIVPLIYLFIMSETCPRACSLHWDAANNFIRTVNSISHPYMYVSSSPSLSLSVAVAVASCRFFMESSQNRVVDYLNEGTTQEGVPHTHTRTSLSISIYVYFSVSAFVSVSVSVNMEMACCMKCCCFLFNADLFLVSCISYFVF